MISLITLKQEMYDKAIKDNPSSLFIADWFVTQQQLDAWFDGHY